MAFLALCAPTMSMVVSRRFRQRRRTTDDTDPRFRWSQFGVPRRVTGHPPRNATYKTKARPSVIEDKVSNVVGGDIAGPLKKALGPLFAFINFVRGEDYPAFRTN